MRILIADDTSELSQPWAETLAKAVNASATPKSANKRGSARETVSMLCATAGADRDTQFPGIELSDQPEQLAAILDALGISLLNRGYVPEGKRLILLALDLRKDFFGKNHPAVAASLTSYARVQRMEGDLLRGSKTINDAVKINRRYFGASGLPLVVTLVESGVLHLYQGKATAAARDALRGLAILKRHRLEAHDPNTSRLLDTLGRALETRGRLTSGAKARALFLAAVRALTKAVKLDLKQVGSNHPKYATHRANLASAQWALGDLDAAEEGFNEVIRVYEQVLQRPLHPNLIDAYANLGSVLTTQPSRRAEAENVLQDALGRNEKSRGPADTLVGNDHANLGRLYFAMGDGARATAEFETALSIYLANVKAKRLPRNHPYIAEARQWLKNPCP